MKIKVTNLNKVDIVIDKVGDGVSKDQVIIHPKASEVLVIEKSVLASIKAMTGVVLQVQN